MSIVFITGANKGIGRETARRLLERGDTVYIGARDPQRGRETAAELDTEFIQIDVTDDGSVASALATLARHEQRLDVLINNAGIPDNTTDVDGISGASTLAVLDTNVAGVVRVTQAALGLLRRSKCPVIVNVSSGLGSFWANSQPDRPESETPLVAYAASKAAVAMLTLKYSQVLPGVKINAACPGLTATDFSAGFPGAQPVEQAVDVILELASAGPESPSGQAFETDGRLAW